MNIDEFTNRARARFRRLGPEQAYTAMRSGAILVDTRPESQRRADGTVPGAIVIERNHLEWRCDPTSSSRIPHAVNHDVRFIIMCDEGYSSSLAAAVLQELGLRNTTDVIGGFQAWRATGLPTVAPHDHR
jgi:rhodanese-related sulfurtransferase